VEKDGLSMVVMSGDMDKVFGAFIIATGAAAAGKGTTMFFTFWGLKAIQKGNFTGKGLMGRMIGVLNRGGIDRIGPSRFNFWGMGRWMFKKMMGDKGVTSLSDLREMAIDLGVKLIPCSMSMEVMEIAKEDMIEAVSEPVGVANFLEYAYDSKVTLFI
jgi:peroxiredoxin family protein